MPLGRQRLHELALGQRDVLPAAELADVRAADVQHDADVGRRDAGEVGDVPDAAGAHLQDEVAGPGVGAQHGERQPDLVVERARAGRRSGRRGPRAAPIRSLVEVLPAEPVTADDGHVRQPVQHAAGRGGPAPSGRRGRRRRAPSTGRCASTAAAPAASAAAAKSCPSARSPCNAANSAPGAAWRESMTTGPSTTASGGPWTRPRSSPRSSTAEVGSRLRPVPSCPPSHGAGARRGRPRGRRTAGPLRATFWPCSWPLPAIDARRRRGRARPTARSIAAARSGSITTWARSGLRHLEPALDHSGEDRERILRPRVVAREVRGVGQPCGGLAHQGALAPVAVAAAAEHDGEPVLGDAAAGRSGRPRPRRACGSSRPA